MLFHYFGFLVLHFCSGQLTSQQRAGLLERHNHYRRVDAQNGLGSGMIEMEWDSDLEFVAQTFANLGPFVGHNSDRKVQYQDRVGTGTNVYGVGENWFSGSPTGGSSPMPEDAVHAWVDFVWPSAWTGNADDCSERQAFNNECVGMTGHFTQVMWEKSYKVGCGYTATHGTTCNYFPPGNFNQQAHSNYDTACETCPSTHMNCPDSLCTASAPTPPPTSPPTLPPTVTGATPAPTPPPTPPPTVTGATPAPTPSSGCTYSTINWSSGCPTGYESTCDGLCYGPIEVIQRFYNPDDEGSEASYNLLSNYNINLNCQRFCCGLGWDSRPCGYDTGALGAGEQGGTQMARLSEPVYIDESSANNHYVYWSSFFSLLSSIYMFL